MGSNQYWAGRVYDLCVYYMTGIIEGSTESGFMEKPGIEPATPGLQGITLIHYSTGLGFCVFERKHNHASFTDTFMFETNQKVNFKM